MCKRKNAGEFIQHIQTLINFGKQENSIMVMPPAQSEEYVQNRINVFISSAQSEEGDTAWTKEREKIKEQLQTCKYLNPYIIEDKASEIPSTQLFTYEVKNADIVVMLIKGEVRQGTRKEYMTAVEYKKPMLVYFIEDDNPKDSVQELCKDIETHDYCTYKNVTSFDGLEKTIFDNVIQNIVFFYRYKHDEQLELTTEVYNLPQDQFQTNFVPTKEIIGGFSGCYEYFFSALNVPFRKKQGKTTKEELNEIGRKLFKWILYGEYEINDGDIDSIRTLTTEVYGSAKWLSFRWKAIEKRIQGKYEDALLIEKQAYEEAKNAEAPNWIANNILIDIRNFENEINPKENDAQKQLDELDSIVYLPVTDRYLNEAYEELLKEDIKISTAPQGTIFLGNNIQIALGNIINYYLSASLYGSFTHMVISRLLVARVVYKYGKLSNNSTWILSAIRMYLLSQSVDEFKNVLLNNWESIYVEISANVDSLWNVVKHSDIFNRNNMMLAFLAQMGLYLSERSFFEAERFIFDCQDTISWDKSEIWLSCVEKNAGRLNQKQLVAAIINVINNEKYYSGRNLCKILFDVDLTDVPQALQIELKEALKKHLPIIIRKNGNPQVIAALANKSKEIFGNLWNAVDSVTSEEDKLLYELNMGSEKWRGYLSLQIKEAELQFSLNNKGLIVSSYAKPFEVISSIVQEHFSDDVRDIITNEYFTLCGEIITSQSSIQIKDSCFKSLLVVASRYIQEKIEIPKSIISIILDYSGNGEDNYPISLSSKGTMFCRAMVLREIVGIGNRENFVFLGTKYMNFDENCRLAFAESLEQYVGCCNKEEIDFLIESLILQCCNDKNHLARACGCRALVLAIKYDESQLLLDELFRLAGDASSYVRSELIYMCKNAEISDKISRDLCTVFQKDQNYMIRKISQEISSK